MGTQVNITIDSGGLVERAKQMQSAMRQAQLEKERVRLVEAEGLRQRTANRAAAGLAADGSPLNATGFRQPQMERRPAASRLNTGSLNISVCDVDSGAIYSELWWQLSARYRRELWSWYRALCPNNYFFLLLPKGGYHFPLPENFLSDKRAYAFEIPEISRYYREFDSTAVPTYHPYSDIWYYDTSLYAYNDYFVSIPETVSDWYKLIRPIVSPRQIMLVVTSATFGPTESSHLTQTRYETVAQSANLFYEKTKNRASFYFKPDVNQNEFAINGYFTPDVSRNEFAINGSDWLTTHTLLEYGRASPEAISRYREAVRKSNETLENEIANAGSFFPVLTEPHGINQNKRR